MEQNKENVHPVEENNMETREVFYQPELEQLSKHQYESNIPLDSPSSQVDSGMSSIPESMQLAEPLITESGTDDEDDSNVSSSGGGEEVVISASIFPVAKFEGKEEVNSKESTIDDQKDGKTETPTKKEVLQCGAVNESQLPDTVTVLDGHCGSKVYIVGTAHFSKESQYDVIKTIRMVRPDVLVLELCKSRFSILQLTEEQILQEAEILDFAKMRTILREQGKMQGILYMLLMSSTAHITKELGMAPGGEFRTAYKEVNALPNCKVILGDRPIDITLSRALASLSLWKKFMLMIHILQSKEPISREDVEKCKKKDFIEELLKDMTGQFPEIHEVFVKERDIFLSQTLQNAAYCRPIFPLNNQRTSPKPVVVGVVGIGHVAGIVENWRKVTPDDIERIMIIPPTPLSTKISLFALKCTCYGCIAFVAYKCLPASLKSNLTSAANLASENILKTFSK